MNNPTKVAVVGVGRFGQHHARVYHELPEAELVGVFDTDAARGRFGRVRGRARRILLHCAQGALDRI